MRLVPTLLVLLTYALYVHGQRFTEESPYMTVRLMDLKTHEFQPDLLDRLENVLDEELKYTDAKKGTPCQRIDFEQEPGYPKQDARFLDLSIRGLCTDEDGQVHDIHKELIIVAIERNIDQFNALTPGTVYSVGNVQFYKRHRNLLNFIIIPISVGFTLLLLIVTFVLRQLRYKQKRRHILSELQKKKETTAKTASSIPNPNPRAGEREPLVMEAGVVGSASNTMGSPKEFTTDQNSTPSRDNRPLYYNEREGSSNSHQRTGRQLFDSDPRIPPNARGYDYGAQSSNIIPLEDQPRVVVRTVHGDRDQPSYTERRGDSPMKFVPIPVQVERSAPPPYHSDPYYRHTNA